MVWLAERGVMYRCWALITCALLALCCPLATAQRIEFSGQAILHLDHLPGLAPPPPNFALSPSGFGLPYLPSNTPPLATSIDNDPDDSDITRYKASTYVPVDSWVYPALERLIALGYIRTGSLAIRPVTRLECQRLLAEAHVINDEAELDSPQNDPNILPLLAALDREFTHESRIANGDRNTKSTLDSIYARYNGIAGRPLRDSFHFGQTVYNDFGRPYGQGGNVVTGLSGHAEYGPFAVYTRGEFQHAASSPAYDLSAAQTIRSFDQSTEAWQLPPGSAVPPVFNFSPAAISRFRLIEGYVAVNVANWQVSAGQESLWWGPDRSTSLMLSNNAAAMPMIRIARAKPAHLPSLLRYLGPIRADGFLARQGGIHYLALGQTFVLNGDQYHGITPPPYVWGAALSAAPTKNLELSLAHTVVFAGYGRPLNLRTFIHTFNVGGNQQLNEPGKPVTEFNVSYHVPYFRRRLLVYSEAMSWDNPIQGHFTERFALDPGVYISQIPYMKKLDLRLEGVYTDLPGLPYKGYFYANSHYSQGYTNYGQILGSWIGRQGRGGQATSTYWFSPQSKASASYRRTVANPALLQGGDLTDGSGELSWLFNRRVEVSAKLQYERWRFPVIATGPTSNLSATFQVQLLNPRR